ncbi:alpha/beta hydrolase family protein [Haloferula sp.]|uniref:alpha/beta hydrolase family protein n=1 Tax=Haloferula sp. TaxID=2497595 RepID=UPI00329CB59E
MKFIQNRVLENSAAMTSDVSPSVGKAMMSGLMILLMLSAVGIGNAQSIPDPLAILGEEKTEAAWKHKGRPATLEFFRKEVYGVTPDRKVSAEWKLDRESEVFGGIAMRREYLLILGDTLSVRVLAFVPMEKGKVPAFLGLNFGGNHTVSETSWITRTSKAPRGKSAGRWPVEMAVRKGIAMITVHCADFDPDEHDGFANGAHALFPEARDESSWGTLGAWAWGLSRVLDHLEDVPEIDAKRVAVIGHSRLGKTALWAGAQDERFAMVVSNNSGCGGAALSKRRQGETIAKITSRFPHWFCSRYSKFADKEDELPMDQHQLIACIAPRPVYVASASDDAWADPEGEFLGLKKAAPVYALFEKEPFMADKIPPADEAIGKKKMRYHLRKGKHDITRSDWGHYFAAASDLLKP